MDSRLYLPVRNGSHCSSKWSKKYGLVSLFRGEPKIEILFYLSMKGQLEDVILELPFEAIVIARPATFDSRRT